MELQARFFAKTGGGLYLQNIRELACALGVKVPGCRVAQLKYIVKYFITSLSVRTGCAALVVGNVEVGRERLNTEVTKGSTEITEKTEPRLGLGDTAKVHRGKGTCDGSEGAVPLSAADQVTF
jgi:hypothetical protein